MTRLLFKQQFLLKLKLARDGPLEKLWGWGIFEPQEFFFGRGMNIFRVNWRVWEVGLRPTKLLVAREKTSLVPRVIRRQRYWADFLSNSLGKYMDRMGILIKMIIWIAELQKPKCKYDLCSCDVLDRDTEKFVGMGDGGLYAWSSSHCVVWFSSSVKLNTLF